MIKESFSKLIFISTLCISGNSFAQQGDVAATVNGVVIKNSELQKAVDINLAMLRQRGMGTISEEENAKLKNDTLNNLITRELFYQKAKSFIALAEISSLTVQRIDAIKKNFPTEADFKEALFRQGASEDEFRNSVEMDAAIEKLLTNQLPLDKVDATEDELKLTYQNNQAAFQFGESVEASHILISVAKDAPEDQQKKAPKEIQAIQKRLKRGEDFEKLARECSKCPSAPNGGKLGRLFRGGTVKPFEDAAFALKENQTSGIVQTQFGYHIIKLHKKLPAGERTLEEMRDNLRQFIIAQKRTALINDYAASLRQGADIRIY